MKSQPKSASSAHSKAAKASKPVSKSAAKSVPVQAAKKATPVKKKSAPVAAKKAAPPAKKPVTPPKKTAAAPVAVVKKGVKPDLKDLKKKPMAPAAAKQAAAHAAKEADKKKSAALNAKAPAAKKTPEKAIEKSPEKTPEKVGEKSLKTADKGVEASPAPSTLSKTPAKATDKSAEKAPASSAKAGKSDDRASEKPARKAKEEALLIDDAKSDEEIVLTDAEGRRYCRVKDCDQISVVDAYCRYHYLLFWKNIQVRKKILSEGKLERYIEELTARYPDKYLEMLRKDLRNEKDFQAAIQELEIDEASVDNEYEDEAQSYLDEVRGMSTTEGATREEEDF